MTTILLLAACTVFQVDPWYRKPILPDADPAAGVVTGTLSFAAAKGETEAVSFVVNPDRDLAKVDVVVSDLKGPGGATVPAFAADVRLVKVWFRPEGRWNTSWGGGRGTPTPVNALVLHDDALVKVDWEKKVNCLRADYPDGTAYLDISRRDRESPFDNDLEPVRDASAFVPFDLKKGFRQQYLVTWTVPKDAAPGDYAGTVRLVADGRETVVTLRLALTVYPFALPRPRTHYDPSAPYYSFWMGTPNLAGILHGARRLDRAERKLRAIYRSMAEHNAVNLSGIGDISRDSTDDLAVRSLIIARQEGMCADPLVNGSAYDRSAGFVRGSSGGAARDPEKAPEDYAKSLARFRDKVVRDCAVLDRLLGHHRCYYQSADECDYTTNQRSYGYWAILHELGARTWTDSAPARHNAVYDDMNAIPGEINHITAADWHRAGAKAVTYAATFTGPENPELWRRIKGLRFWYADHDGQHEFCLFDGSNRWNEFTDRGRYGSFGIVFLTQDGLVSTLAWEAVREALDDVRYFSLLRLRAKAALASSDPETRRLGRKALVWQDAVDPEYVHDLNAFRRETAEWIAKLVAKVGPEPAERETELPPPALPADVRAQTVPPPSAGAKKIFDYAAKTASEDRYDLALPALEGLLGHASAETADRVQAALRLAELHLTLRERTAAVAALDRAIALRDVKASDRGKLALRRVGAMMTEARYQETFGTNQLDRAAAALEEALKLPGAGEAERFAAIRQVAEGYLAEKAYGRCLAFSEARLKDTKLSGRNQAVLHVLRGKGWRGLEAWAKSLKAFDEAHRANNDEKDPCFLCLVLEDEARSAEQEKDYVRAFDCWMRRVPLYDRMTEGHRLRRAKENTERLAKLVQKTKKVPGASADGDGAAAISLDE